MSFRRDFISKPIFSWARGVLPAMSDTEREAAQREHIQGLAGEVEHDEGHHDRQRNRHGNDERTRQVPEKNQNHGSSQQRAV